MCGADRLFSYSLSLLPHLPALRQATFPLEPDGVRRALSRRERTEATMRDATKILTEHPYASLFLAVLAEQIGLPFPAVLFLTAAGALAAMGHGDLGLLLLTGSAATLLADLFWYTIGRSRKHLVKRLIHWLSPEPGGYARRAWKAFRAHGEPILVWAKFVPSLSTFTTPLAGAARIPLGRFLAFNGAGTVLWNGAFLLAGYSVGPEIGRIAQRRADVGAWLAAAVLGALVGLVAWRWLKTRTRVPRPVVGLGEARPAAQAEELGEPSAVDVAPPDGVLQPMRS
jgi:membrane protein DedA with SNARE-associated domain